MQESLRSADGVSRSELEFRRFLEKLPAAAYTCNVEGHITYFNHHAVDLWGREPKLNDPADRFCGSFKLASSDGTPVEHDQCWMALALQDGKEYNGREDVVERQDGSRCAALAHVNPIHDDSGKLIGAVNVVVDISARKRAEEVLKDADRSKTQFLAMLAHELRNPLAPIHNGLQIMRLANDDLEAINQAREMMERQVGQMARLIDDLLDLSRITNGKLKRRNDRIDLITAVQDAIETSRPCIDAAGHELTVNFPTEPVFVDGDRGRLTQVFTNLLNNSAKFTNQAGHIWLTLERHGSDAVVKVRDNGAGILAENLERIFDLFTQSERLVDHAQGGLGIGLNLVRGLIEMHGGRVEAHSDGLGKGAEFVVRLPIMLRYAREQDMPADKVLLASRYRVLVVDDNKDSAVTLAMTLKLMGHTTQTAHNGLEALKVAEDFKPEVILLDIGLPKLNGYEVCRHIRQQDWGERMVLIALTGWGQEEDKMKSMEAGFNFHMVKPVAAADLGKLLDGLLSARFDLWDHELAGIAMQTATNKSSIQTPSQIPSADKGSGATFAVEPVNTVAGLASDEAGRRLKHFGPNAVPDTTRNPLRVALDKFWAPVPWMLEAAIVLQTALGEYVEAAIIAGLLVFNAALGFFQEGRAQATLAALKSRLALGATVRRNGIWTSLPATELVPGDVVQLSLGSVVAADVRLVEGSILLDQSMLTGESIPIEAGPDFQTFAGALVRRGEAVAEVTATGIRTKFGRTAELVLGAHVVSSQQKAVLRVVRNLALFNGTLIVILVAYAWVQAMPLAEIISLVLTAVLASIPVALPATFTLAAAVGARSLGRQGVLPTRLSAVDEAASIDVLCADKTGTLTRNELTVTSVRPMSGFNEAHVLGLAALTGSDGGKDPVDAAISSAAARNSSSDLPKRTAFVPFDPATKMSEATAVDPRGAHLRIVKGAFAVVAGLTQSSPLASTAAGELEAQGFRVLAVAVGPPPTLQLAGLIALSDPPRADSAALIKELLALGVRTVMVTGDAPATAAIVAHAVGLDGPVSPPGPIPDKVRPEDFAVFAGVLPEGKYDLVKTFQKDGHAVGMCGDGANDAPALRQAQMGIAVSTATDVAKSAAGIVLTKPGLGGIVASVKEGRVTFQRILTYTLNSVTKKVVQVLFLALGLVMTGHAILTPMLMVIIMITGDFLGMSLTTDNVRPSPSPNSWQIGRLTLAGVFMGIAELVFCGAVLAIGKFGVGLEIGALRTLAFILIVFGNQATMYANRERRRLWSSCPGYWLVVSSVVDLLIASTLAACGIFMTPLPIVTVLGTLTSAVAFAFVVDAAKSPVFARLGIA